MSTVGDCPVVAFVGRSGSGKTTLLARLIPALARRSVRVAVVKHSPVHDVESDAPGTDTHRFWEAGAEHVTLVSRDRVVHAHRYPREADLDAVLAGVRGVDLVLLEGYKRCLFEKIEVVRQAHDPRLLDGLKMRIACVTDVENVSVACPVFGLDDFEKIADFLVDRLGGR